MSVSKKEFEEIANKILNLNFNSGRAVIGVRVNEKNFLEFFWKKIETVGDDWTPLEIKEYSYRINECVIAYKTLAKVWNFLGEKPTKKKE